MFVTLGGRAPWATKAPSLANFICNVFFLSFFLSVVIPILSKERKITMSDDVCIVAMKYKKGYIEGYPIENFL